MPHSPPPPGRKPDRLMIEDPLVNLGYDFWRDVAGAMDHIIEGVYTSVEGGVDGKEHWRVTIDPDDGEIWIAIQKEAYSDG